MIITSTSTPIGHRANGPLPARLWAAALLAALAVPAPAFARESLGVFGQWGAFRDAGVPRCYAIAMAQPSAFERAFQPYAAIGTWPRRNERGQVHLRLSRQLAAGSKPVLTLGDQRFQLVGGGADAWAADRAMDAAIVAAMRSARTMQLSARDARGRPFGNAYDLAGAATAMDTATLACARL
jgi:hypothetical protein